MPKEDWKPGHSVRRASQLLSLLAMGTWVTAVPGPAGEGAPGVVGEERRYCDGLFHASPRRLVLDEIHIESGER